MVRPWYIFANYVSFADPQWPQEVPDPENGIRCRMVPLVHAQVAALSLVGPVACKVMH